MRPHPILILSLFAVPACSSDPAQLQVPGDNREPVIGELSEVVATVGQTVNVPVDASDPDGDDLTLRLVPSLSVSEIREGYTPDALLTEAPVTFQFTPAARDRPSRSFKIVATDGRGAESERSFQVRVDEP